MRLRSDSPNAGEERNIFNLWRWKKSVNWMDIWVADNVPYLTSRHKLEVEKWLTWNLSVKELLKRLKFSKLTAPDAIRTKIVQLDHYCDLIDTISSAKTMNKIKKNRLELLSLLGGNHASEKRKVLAHVWASKRIPLQDVFTALKMDDLDSLKKLFLINSGQATLEFFVRLFFASHKYGQEEKELANVFLKTYDHATIVHILRDGYHIKSAKVLSAPLEMSLVRIWRERSSHDEVFYNFLQLNRIRYKLFDSFEMQVWNQFLTPDVAVATTLKYLMRNYDISFLCDALISGQTQLDLRKGIQRALLDLWQEQKMDLRTAISKLKLDGFTKNNEAFEVRVQMLEMHVLLVKWNENWNKEEKAWLEKTWTAFKRMRKDSEKNNDLLQWKPLMELLENPPSDLQRSNTILKLETN